MKNEYVKRKVALKDTQACLICNKATTVVLYNASGPDWFYVCEIHLQDNPQFAKPIFSKEYEQEVQHLRQVKQKISATAAIKNGNWDGWITKLFSKHKDGKNDSKSNNDDNENDKKEEDSPTDDNTSDNKGALPSDLTVLQQEYDETLDRVTKLQKSSRAYQLSDISFQNRVQHKKNRDQQELRKKQLAESYTDTDPEELLEKFSFPSVPKK